MSRRRASLAALEDAGPTTRGCTLFFAWRDAVAAPLRTLLLALVVGLVAMLVVVVSGFASGLTEDTTSAITRLPATHLAFAGSASSEQFSRSLVATSAADRFAATPGVRAATPFGTTIVHARSSAGTDLDLAVFGVVPGSLMAPRPATGAPLVAGGGGVVVSQQLADKGVRVGQRIAVATPAVTMPVVGITGRSSFGHVAAAYVELPTWQRLRFSVPSGQPLPQSVAGQASGIALEVDATSGLAAADRLAGTRTVSKRASYGGAPGYSGENTIMSTIRFFLLAIAALIVAAFFLVSTLQRSRELAVIRALGASGASLLRTTFFQATLLVVPAVLLGALAGAALGAVLKSSVPFLQTPASVTNSVVTLSVMGIAGALVAAGRVTRVDPLTALSSPR